VGITGGFKSMGVDGKSHGGSFFYELFTVCLEMLERRRSSHQECHIYDMVALAGHRRNPSMNVLLI